MKFVAHKHLIYSNIVNKMEYIEHTSNISSPPALDFHNDCLRKSLTKDSTLDHSFVHSFIYSSMHSFHLFIHSFN